MGIPLYLIFLTIILLSVTVVGKTMYNRKKVTCMTGMMIAMTLGMIVGLTMGVVFGILFIDNFFVATILGMVVGMVIGFLSGIDRKSTRLNSRHVAISYAVLCLKKHIIDGTSF